MKLNTELLKKLNKEYGDAFYLLDSKQFIDNFKELKQSFTSIYPRFNIAYSYKTNYIPKLCKIINDLGGLAEVVSDMELEIAFRVGVKPQNIIWNGPVKNSEKVKDLLLKGGVVNLDSYREIDLIEHLSKEYPESLINIGIRCNFDVHDGVTSRFGFDVQSEAFFEMIKKIKLLKNVVIKNLQCHFATRSLDIWKFKVKGMLDLIDKLDFVPENIDMGGGLFGKMANSLKRQFTTHIPSYNEYATFIATEFEKKFKNSEIKPTLLIEPGSALVGDCMSFASKVTNIKCVRGKYIATLLGSIYNINPTLNTKNPPLTVYHYGNDVKHYDGLDFGGFTCIESDYLYKNYIGNLSVDDMVVFGNVGSYSVVLKPPFILPNFPVLDVCGETVEVIKRKETFDDIFHTYSF